MPFELPALPYSAEALEPHYSAKTLSFHHGKHHKTYVDNLNNLVKGTSSKAEVGLEAIVHRERRARPTRRRLFNNAAQIWNHTFYWNSLKPNGGGAAHRRDRRRDRHASFGSYDGLQEPDVQGAGRRAPLRLAAGTWLVADADGKLEGREDLGQRRGPR
jgi:Fe-Mn family superoxide dismutase